MENIILRAMRTFDESVCAPEYARNQLAIEIIFPEPPVFINELAVRVYSEDYQLIGADVYSPSSRKTPRIPSVPPLGPAPNSPPPRSIPAY